MGKNIWLKIENKHAKTSKTTGDKGFSCATQDGNFFEKPNITKV